MGHTAFVIRQRVLYYKSPIIEFMSELYKLFRLLFVHGEEDYRILVWSIVSAEFNDN